MRLPFPGIGVVFNLDELKDGYHAVKVFMSCTDPKQLASSMMCTIFDGDVKRPPSEVVRSYYDYCVAVCGPALDLNYVKKAFGRMDDPRLAPMHRRFIEKPLLDQIGLTEMGIVDVYGRLVTDEWTRMEHDLCKEAGWGYDPQAVHYDLDESLRLELEQMRKGKVK